MSDPLIGKKYEEFIGLDKPPVPLDIDKFSTIKPSALVHVLDVLLTDWHREYFTKISRENKEKIEESFRALYEDCDQQQSGVARIDSAVAGLRKLLNMIEKDLKNYLDEAVEKTIEKMSDDKDSLYMQTMNVGLWHMMADFLPQSMNWFVKLVRKLLTSIVEDKPVDTVIVCRFFSSFSRDFLLPLNAIINPTLNYTLLLETV